MGFLLLGSDGPPGFWYPSRAQSVEKVRVGDGNNGVAGVVQPPVGNVFQDALGQVCDEVHGTVEKGSK